MGPAGPAGASGSGGALALVTASLTGAPEVITPTVIWADDLTGTVAEYNFGGYVLANGSTFTVGNPGWNGGETSWVISKTHFISRDGARYAEAKVTLGGNSGYMRSGIMLSTTPNGLSGYFIAFEGAAVGGIGQAIRVLKFTNGALGGMSPDRYAAFGHVTGRQYTVSARLTATNVQLWIDGVAILDFADTTFTGDLYVGWTHFNPGDVNTSAAVDRFDIVTAMGGGTVSTALGLVNPLPDDLLIGWQDGGRSGRLHALFPAMPDSLAGKPGRAVAYQRAQGTLRLVPGLEWPPAGAGLSAGGRLKLTDGLRAPGRVVGFAERGQDSTMSAWNYIHQGDPVGTTVVNPVTGEVALSCNAAPWGFAWITRMKFDPRFDFTMSADVKTELLSGAHSFGALVALSSEYNYTGIMQTLNISNSSLPDVIHHEIYGDEGSSMYQSIPGAIPQNQYHRLRLTYVAATQTMFYYVDDLVITGKPWVSQGAVGLWICSVGGSGGDGTCRITYRNVMAVGTPVQGAAGFDSLTQETIRAAGQTVVVDRTTATGRDYITGAGTVVSRVLVPINPGEGWRELIMGGTAGVRVSVADADGALVPDAMLPGNAAGFAPGSVDLRGVSVEAYPALTFRATLGAGDKLYELRVLSR